MPKTKKVKSRAYKAKKSFKFKWWMALVLILIVGGIGLVILRFSEAATTIAPKGPIYWLGDSLSTGMVVSGDLVGKLQNNGYTPARVNANPGRSITGGGFPLFEGDTNGQSALSAVDADNKNICPGATAKSIVDYCKQHQQKYNPVADAKTVVIFLGTNPELSTDSFSNLQKQLVTKIRSINPKAAIVWGDIASPGNYSLALEGAINWENYFRAVNGRKLLTPGTVEYTQFVDNFNANYDTTRKRLQNNLYKIYQNSTVNNYSIVSQLKFLWGENILISQFSEKENQKDPNGYLNADGVHYEAIGSQRLSDYFLSRLSTGRFSRSTDLPTFFDLTKNLEIKLIAPPEGLSVSQAGVGQNCSKQIGFKSNTDFRGCNITSSTPINISTTSSATKTMLFPNNKLNVCLGSLSNNRSPITVKFLHRGKDVGSATLNYGSGSELSSLQACGITNKTISEVETIQISSPGNAILTNLNLSTVK